MQLWTRKFFCIFAMAKKRITIYMIAPFIFIVTVVGLFFSVTDPTSWPKQTIELSSTDMRLAPPVSTIWCESLSMSSMEDFAAYRVQHEPKIDHNALTRQTINLKLKIDNRRRRVDVHELRYFLLPGSVINIVPCAMNDKARVYVWKHEFPRKCLLANKKMDSSDYDDDNNESDDDSSDDNELKRTTESVKSRLESCSESLGFRDIPVTHMGDQDLACGNRGSGLFTINITTADTYVVVVTNENQRIPNFIRLQILLDRTFYNYHKLQKSTSICGGSSTSPCNIHLTFASGERVLLWVPPMRMLSTRQKLVTITTQCRPRIALFALLTVLFPVLLFILVSFVLRNDRRRFREQSESLDSDADVISSRRESFVSPLLPQASNRNSASGQVHGTSQERSCSDIQPPAYETLFDLPPAYSSLTISSNDKS